MMSHPNMETNNFKSLTNLHPMQQKKLAWDIEHDANDLTPHLPSKSLIYPNIGLFEPSTTSKGKYE